jgi:HEAT repeat protein
LGKYYFGIVFAPMKFMKIKAVNTFNRKSNLVSGMLVLFLLGNISFAQESKSKTQTNIPALIRKLKDKDKNVVENAHQTLLKLKPQVIPVAVEMLKTEKQCIDRMTAAEVLIELDPKNQALTPALVEIVKGRTASSSEEELLCRRSAAFALGLTPDGIQALAELLKDEDLFVRRSAIFAFDDLTETANYPEGSLQIMKAAIPVIVQASKDQDEVLSEMADEVLGQIVRGGNKELSETAKQAMGQRQ